MSYEIIIGAEFPKKLETIERKRKWKLANPEKLKLSGRKAQLKRKYGITIEDYNRMLLAQNGHCALCDKTPEDERDKVLSVDHCHETRRVRGLLCNIHNRALGAFGDNEEGLLKAIAYLKAPG